MSVFLNNWSYVFQSTSPWQQTQLVSLLTATLCSARREVCVKTTHGFLCIPLLFTWFEAWRCFGCWVLKLTISLHWRLATGCLSMNGCWYVIKFCGFCQVSIPRHTDLVPRLQYLACHCDHERSAESGAQCLAGIINKLPEGTRNVLK